MDRETEEVIRAIQGGDDARFEELFQMSYPRALQVADRLLRDSVSAEEIAQEAMIRVFSSIKKFERFENFNGWVYRITVNLCRDLWRSQARRHEVPVDDVTADPTASSAGGARAVSQVDRIAGDELATAVRFGIERLPEQQRLAAILVLVEGLTVRETAETLGSSAGAVKMNLWYARKKLGTDLVRFGFEP